MKARISRPCRNGLFWGEVWDERFKYWRRVTTGCLTERGCRRELEKYKRYKEGPYCEFEL